ncbi:hypothetical protein GYMLUDRAFT_1024858 [Collybiopsis luxurians FD-317 M1]|uniref:Uncharacterized protein n=1 Tax=Collybiopsis luxurians FD-317 M1 TaxID=944289 RepID=A0A0D0ATM9_9AGAR|nr:hypothetical protein GYMLUDRAFT_1024858 [Collybiopsis luxurians FD-317 M1]
MSSQFHERRSETPLVNEELLPVFEAVQRSWEATLQSAPLVSTLLAATASQLLGTVLSNGTQLSSVGLKTCLFFSYGAIIFNIGATISSFVLSEIISSIPVLVKLNKIKLSEQIKHTPSISLLELVLRKTSYRLLLLHWLGCFILGIISLLMQVLIYVGFNEGTVFTVLMSIGGFISIAPIIYLFQDNTKDQLED